MLGKLPLSAPLQSFFFFFQCLSGVKLSMYRNLLPKTLCSNKGKCRQQKTSISLKQKKEISLVQHGRIRPRQSLCPPCYSFSYWGFRRLKNTLAAILTVKSSFHKILRYRSHYQGGFLVLSWCWKLKIASFGRKSMKQFLMYCSGLLVFVLSI